MPINDHAARRTAVYIDGYNLYYGRIRGSTHKWLDLVHLSRLILEARDQNESLSAVKLFTAYALAKFATHGQASVEAQSAYHRAMKQLHGDLLEIEYGEHTYDKNGSAIPTFVPGQPFDRQLRSRVWRIEEKKTDVNLAICMYRDLAKGRYDRIVLISNDSDAEPALKAIREDFPNVHVGVVMPVKPTGPDEPARRASGSLAAWADWTQRSISDELLENSQLPLKVPTKKKPIAKPQHW